MRVEYLEKHAERNVGELANLIEIDTGMTSEQIQEVIVGELDRNNFYKPDVIYYAEAWEIVTSMDYSPYDPGALDFSGCETASDCVMYEAREIIREAYYSVLASVLERLGDDIESFSGEALDRGYSGKLTVSISSVFGWAVHESETGDGICIYKNIEGEPGLTALEKDVGPFYVSVIWNENGAA